MRGSSTRIPPTEAPVVPPEVTTVLSVLRSSAVVVNEEDVVLKASAPAYALGLVRNNEMVDPELADLVRQVRRDGQIRETELVIARTPSSPPRHVTARVAPLGSRLVLALVEDRTRERRVEAIRRDFVANVSHELKTPVGAIRLLAEAVQDASDDPEAVETVRRPDADRERAAGPAGAAGHRAVPAAVRRPARAARRRCPSTTRSPPRSTRPPSTPRRAGSPSSPSGEKGLKVLGNREQITVAISNLVANAVNYSPDRSSVLVATRAADDMVEISVTDQGIGIPSTEIDRIFERFYRVDPARHRSTGGTGLGLSIVKHVAATHGGDIRVWSVEGQGSTFTLALPRKNQEGRP